MTAYGVMCAECPDDRRVDHGVHDKVSDAVKASRRHADANPDHYPQVITLIGRDDR